LDRRLVALGCTLTIALATGACTYNEAENRGGVHQGKGGGGKNVCYEKVIDIDKKTGQAHYVNRAIPCPK
jgi:hypothetical protein